MLALPFRFSYRVLAGTLAAAVTVSAAGAATYHRFAVTSTAGSGGATAIVQSTAAGSALQGEVSSSANTSIKLPFGVLGEYNPAGSSPPFGIGVAAISTTGYSVAGESLGNQPSVLGLAGGTGVGVEASTPKSSSAEAFFGEALGSGRGATLYADGSGAALFASSNEGFGIFASSQSADGVHGEVDTNATAVAGINDAAGNGIAGISATGFGMQAFDQSTTVQTASDPPYRYAAAFGQSTHGPGVYGVNVNIGSDRDYGPNYGLDAGVYGFGNAGPGVYSYSNNDYGEIVENASQLPTLLVNARNTNSGGDFIFVAESGDIFSTSATFAVQQNGDTFTEGYFYSGSQNPNTNVATYSAQQTEATVEDLGSARLINGNATIAIAGDFQKTTDGSSRYMVFLTPYGDTNGLYVASRTANGFVVRETHGGRNSLDFDYRVVAHAYGTGRGQRLPQLKHRRIVPHGSVAADRLTGKPVFDGSARVADPYLHRTQLVTSHESPVLHDLVEHRTR